MTPHPQHPFNQQVANAPGAASGQPPTPANQPPTESSQPPASAQPPPSQDSAPPAPFSSIEHADANNDVWGAGADNDKWMSSFHTSDFGTNFGGGGLGDFSATTFGIAAEDDIINYGDFLNEDGGLNVDMNMWEELGSTET
jgi:hypothetical protein